MAKSFFFQKFYPEDPQNQHFVKDLVRLAALPRSTWEPLLARVGEYVRASNTPGKRAVVEDVAAKTALPTIEVAYHMRCFDTLLAVFSENEGERPDHLAADFIEIAGLSEELAPNMRELFQAVLERFRDDVSMIDEEDARTGVLPVLDLVRTTCELRGVFHRTLDGQQRLESTVGIISVQLSFDSTVDAFFQVDAAGLQYLIAELQAALERLTMLEERQGLNSANSGHVESRTA